MIGGSSLERHYGFVASFEPSFEKCRRKGRLFVDIFDTHDGHIGIIVLQFDIFLPDL